MIKHRIALAVAAVVATAGATVAGTLPASAAASLSATSPNNQAYGSASVGFTESGYARWDSIYLNDRCKPGTDEGDGVRARMDLYIYQYGRTIKVGSREDVGGCTSAPYRGDAHWASGGPLDRAGFRVCSKGGCSGITWAYNPYA